MKTKCGTESYMAPEVLTGDGYDGTKADVFCAGIMLYIFASGRPPFNGAKPNDARWVKYFVGGKMNEFWAMVQARNGVSHCPEFRDIISRLLHHDPKQRITIAEIKKHPFWKMPFASLADIKENFSCRQFKVDTELIKSNFMKQKERVVTRISGSKFDGGVKATDEMQDELDKWDFDTWQFDDKLWKHAHDHIDETPEGFWKYPVPHMDYEKHEHTHEGEKPLSCFHTKGDFKDFLQIILYGSERQGCCYKLGDVCSKWKIKLIVKGKELCELYFFRDDKANVNTVEMNSRESSGMDYYKFLTNWSKEVHCVHALRYL